MKMGRVSKTGGMILTWETAEVLREKRTPVPLYPPQISHAPSRNPTRDLRARGQQLRARITARTFEDYNESAF